MDGFDAWICFRATEPGADQASWGFIAPTLLKRLDPGLRGVLRTLMPSLLVLCVEYRNPGYSRNIIHGIEQGVSADCRTPIRAATYWVHSSEKKDCCVWSSPGTA
jgi:hypothetical protein